MKSLLSERLGKSPRQSVARASSRAKKHNAKDSSLPTRKSYSMQKSPDNARQGRFRHSEEVALTRDQ